MMMFGHDKRIPGGDSLRHTGPSEVATARKSFKPCLQLRQLCP
jgi:hypothetical protein